MSNFNETLKLIEKCLAMKEDRILRCGNNDPWGYSSMCAALGLLETHLGNKTAEAAKASAAERFIGLHYKLIAYQVPSSQQADLNTPRTGQDPINRAKVSGKPLITYESMLTNAQSITPFPLDAATTMQLGNTPWQRDGFPLSMPWLLPAADPNQPGTNTDMSLDILGMDLDELWGGDFNGGDFA